MKTLADKKIKASFFFTGRFYRNRPFKTLIKGLKTNGHYLGAHSDEHLLYCDWKKRDSLLVTKHLFRKDLEQNYREMERFGVRKTEAPFFLPPYEWYNDSISAWTKEMGLQLINFSPGTISPADYTVPSDNNYRGSEAIFKSIIEFEKSHASGLNGFILLLHIGTAPGRTDKFYYRLPELLSWLQAKGYQMKTVEELLSN